ncbi:MAG: endonuclease/exonuclease/phosphatase family protein [Leptolyngbyaceae cyanobacterium]
MVATDLFFSEYVEGSSFNKALEIANFTGSDIDLSEYSVEIYFNGNTSPNTALILSGTLADGNVYVIADDGADAAILSVADLTPSNSFFNGNDAIALLRNGQIVDVFGQIGVDPGSSWPGGGANVTLRRQSAITAGDPDGSDAFDASAEWDSFPSDTFDGLGTHTIDNGSTTPSVSLNELRISSPSASDNDSNFVELFGEANTTLDGLSLVLLSGEFEPGQVDFAFDLSGTATDENGFFLLANADISSVISQAEVDATDQIAAFDFIGSPSTFLVVDGFTGQAGDDLDVDNDGVFDSAIGTIIDSVSLIDGDSNADVNYSDTVLGPSGTFPPAGIARDVDGTGPFQPLAFGDFSADTPGFSNEAPPPPDETTPIFDIQGAAHTSPLLGQTVTTTGIVTAVDDNGFYLQDAVGDGNIATSDAIFVFTDSAPGISVGDELAVAGTVAEFTPGGASTRNLSTTQISGVSNVTVISSGNDLPAAVSLGQGGRVPPSANIDDDAFASFDPSTDGIDFFESLEGMRVTAQNAVAVSGTNRFGEIFTVVDGGADASGLSDRGTLNISPDDFNPEKVQIDEDSGVFDFEFPEVNVGDVLGDVTGVVSYGFGNFEILPTEDFTGNIKSSELPPDVSSLVGDDDSLTVASYNVLNLDPIVEDQAKTNNGEARNVDDDLGNGRFDAIAAQIVNNLNSPDIIGLQEVQDNTGGEIVDDVTSASETLQLLIDKIVAAGGPEYEFVDNPFITDEASGGQPGGNIRTAFLYNPDRVDLVADSVQTIGGQGAGEAFEGARLPLVADFEFNGETVTVVNNHFSSKGGSAPILGVEQPFDQRQEDVSVNGSLDERQAQSQAVQDFVNGLADDANVVVVGDFNEFEFVSPVEELATNSGLTNLTHTLPADERYSFIFQGNSQALDHILVSENLAADAEFDIVHVNSEFAETDSRASDHDPLLTRLTFAAPVNVIDAGTAGRDRLTGTDGNDRMIGSQGRDQITTGGGNDVIVYTSIVEAGDIITDFAVGSDQIDLSEVLTSLGYDGNDAFADGYLGFSNRNADTVLTLDADGTAGSAQARSFLLAQDAVLTASDIVV